MQGEAEHCTWGSIEERSVGVADRALPDQLIDLLPANPFLDFTGARPTSTIGVVIFAAFLGLRILQLHGKNQKMQRLVKKGIDAIYSLIMGDRTNRFTVNTLWNFGDYCKDCRDI